MKRSMILRAPAFPHAAGRAHSGRMAGCPALPRTRGPVARSLAIGAAVMLLALQSGCVLLLVGGAAAAGVGGYAYVKGESTTTLAASMDRSWNAALAALEDLRLPVSSKANDALSGRISARNANDTSISISLRRVSDNATEIGIRVGTFGDEAQSKAILERISAHL